MSFEYFYDCYEVHNLCQRGNLPFFKICFAKHELLSSHFIDDPTVSWNRWHEHSHLHIVVGRLPMVMGMVPWVKGLFRFSGSSWIIGEASWVLPGRERPLHECIFSVRWLLILNSCILPGIARLFSAFPDDPFDGVISRRYFYFARYNLHHRWYVIGCFSIR